MILREQCFFKLLAGLRPDLMKRREPDANPFIELDLDVIELERSRT